jgi:hypothetical protein
MINVEDFKGGDIYLSDFVSNTEVTKVLELIKNDIKGITWNDLIFSKSRRNILIKLPEFIADKIKELNDKFSSENEICSRFTMLLDDDIFNRTHVDGLPNEFIGIGLGYKMYKCCAKNLGYITSSDSATMSAKKIWSYLIRDSDFYVILTHDHVLVIDKTLPVKKIETIVFKFLKTHISYPTKFSKDWLMKYYAKDEHNKIYIDNELCDLFKDKKLNRLNQYFFKRYFKIRYYLLRSKYNEIDAKYPYPKINQKCFYINEDLKYYEGKIISINDDENYQFDYNDGNFSAKRSNLIIAEEADEKYNIEYNFNVPVYKKYSKECFVCDYCDYVELKSKMYFGLKSLSVEDYGYSFSTKVKINSINDFEIGKKYIIETPHTLFVAEILNITKNKHKLHILQYFAYLSSDWGYNNPKITYQIDNKKKYITFDSIKNVYKMKKES